jgi:hypothetical protein
MENKDKKVKSSNRSEKNEESDKSQPRQSHENRENPRADHPTGHLGYNKTHLDTNPGPVVEGSDKI